MRLVVQQVEYRGHAKSYVRLSGIQLLILGLNYFVIARAEPNRISGQSPILASVPERLIISNALFLVLILDKLLPFSLGLAIIVFNSILAVITFLIWYKTTEDASVRSFFKETFWPLLVRCLNGKRGPFVALHAFGVVEFLIGCLFSVRPGFANVAFQLQPFQDHAAGYLGAFFALFAQCAWQQIYMGKIGSIPFIIANVLSRFALKIPLLVILSASKQIDVGLLVFLGALDFIFGFIILLLLFLLREYRENTEETAEMDAILPSNTNN